VLKQARDEDERVIITGHHPPGKVYKSSCFQAYLDLSQRFDAQIAGSIFGHYHNDDFHILRDDDSGAVAGVAWQTPSLEPSLNPGIRVWKYSASEGSLLDYDQYFADVDEANTGTSKFPWRLEYSAKHAYKLQDMSARSWNQLLREVTTNPEGELAKSYEKHKRVSSKPSEESFVEWRQNTGASFLAEKDDFSMEEEL